ncbi:MAG: allantoinase PuuE, partial [Aestuariivirga sp.]
MAELEKYARNMKGYGGKPPNPKWPGGAYVAVQFVLNYEEGSENNILHGDAASEAFLSEIVGAGAWQGQRHWNMESIYEYGARAGFWRLHEMFTSRKIPVTIYGVATALQRSPEQVAAMLKAQWEIASHGLKWIEHKDMAEDMERASIEKAIRIHTEVTGERPFGWYTGRCSMHTTKLVMEEGGFLYSSDDYSDDLPYFLNKPDGKKHLIIPYTLDANDMRFATPQGFNTGEHFYQYLKDSFDCLYEEGKKGSPKMMTVGLHCRLAGRPGRALGIAKFMDYITKQKKVW